MLIHERVLLIIKANKETPSSFADKIGLKRSNLSHVLSGRNKPSLDFLSKIITSYPKVNASWLITGVTREGDFEEEVSRPEQNKQISPVTSIDKDIEKIVVLYKDGTFTAYSSSEL